MLRVCRPEGVIGLANWTPDGMIGEMLRLVGRYVPPPPGVQPPTRWGTDEALHEMLGDQADVHNARREHLFRYLSPEHFADFFRAYYGPIERKMAAIDARAKDELSAELIALAERWNTATDGQLLRLEPTSR